MHDLNEKELEARRIYARDRTQARTQKQKDHKRRYHTEWQRKNPDKVKLYNKRFYAKKAAQMSDKQDYMAEG